MDVLMQWLGYTQSESLIRALGMVLLLEVPPAVLIAVAATWARLRRKHTSQIYTPTISCSVSCYGEGEVAVYAARTLVEQVYPASIQIICVVDGALQNGHTLAALRRFQKEMEKHPLRNIREVVVIPKWQRGGRVSTQNTGLYFATGEVLISCDADTTFDNDMVRHAVLPLADPNVVAVSGNLRVRNWKESIWTRLQAIEYLYSIGINRTGLSFLNAVNNVSGAFGIFRTSMLRQVGGWINGSAEDLDLTLRLKQYFGRKNKMAIRFAADAVGYTDAPASLVQFLKQRQRWDGDLAYLYFRKHTRAFNPSLVGWTNFVALGWLGLVHQIALPFLILGYSCWLLIAETQALVPTLALLYILYTTYILAMQVLSIALFSRHRWQDIRLLPWCFVYFPFSYAYRIWSGFSILTEVFLKTHLDSTMAPYWVLKRAQH